MSSLLTYLDPYNMFQINSTQGKYGNVASEY